MLTDKDRVRLGSEGLEVLSSGVRSGGCKSDLLVSCRKEASPKRTTAPRVGRFSKMLSIVVGARSWAYSSGDSENVTVLDRRKVSRGRMAGSKVD